MAPYEKGELFKNVSNSDKEVFLQYLLELSNTTENLIFSVEGFYSNDIQLLYDANKAKIVLNKIDKMINHIEQHKSNKTTKKFFYVINYWEDFPASEYGGVVNVIAENDEEVLALLQENFGFNEGEDQGNLTMEWIASSEKFPLDIDHESRIVTCFTT